MAEDQQIMKIYEQDCQFVRYHDGLLWGRLQTAAVIEGGMLYGLYGANMHLGGWEKECLALIGAVLVFFTCLLTFTGRIDIDDHKRRMQKFEKDAGNPFERSKHRYLQAPAFLKIVLVLLTAANGAILWRQWLVAP
jgi:hypothetical protein